MADQTQPNPMDQALAASAANDTAKAIELFSQACELAPSDPVPHFLLGAELAQAGRHSDAELAYAGAVALAPGFAIARYELGTLQFLMSRITVALVTWQPLLELPNGDPLKLFVQGFGCLTQSQPEQAIDYFRKGIEANTTNAALNANIRRLIERIESTPVPTSAPGGDGNAEASHVLLGAYRRQETP